MLILARKAFRDLWHARLRTLAIISAIVLSVGLGVGLVNATRDIYESFDRRYEATNYEDVDIHFEIGAVNISGLKELPGVRSAMGRLMLPTQAEVDGEKFETHWISSPYYPDEPYSEINGYHIIEGRSISSPGAAEALVGNLFAREHGVEPGDAITVLYANRSVLVTVVGVAGSPEYLYAVGDAGWPQPGKLLPLFTTYEFAAGVLGLSTGTYNEVLVRTESGSDPEETRRSVEGCLAGQSLKITRSIKGTEETDYIFSRADADGMEKTGWAFGMIVLVVTAVVIYNTMNQLIASQRPCIGVMRALGGKGSRILVHYCIFGLILGILGSGIGVICGIGISVLVVYLYAGFMGLSEPVYTVFWEFPAIFGFLGIFITTAGAFIGSLRALSIGPREALTSQYNTAVFSHKPIVERLLDLFGKHKNILARVPLRNLSRHRIRTGVTVVALAFSMILVFATIALANSFTKPIEDNYDRYEKWDLQAALVDYHPRGTVERSLGNISGDGITAEPAVRDFVAVRRDDRLVFARVQAFSENSTLRSFHVIEGRNDPDSGILVGSILAKDLGLEPGGEVTLVVGNATSTVRIAGITGELMDDSFLMTLAQADSYLYTGGSVNSVLISMGDSSREDIERSVHAELPVASFSYTEDVITGMESLMRSLLMVFFIFIAFGVIAEVLFISTTVVLSILDREMEFISLRAMGADPGRIRRMVVSESLFLLVLGLIIGLPLGALTSQWTFEYLMAELMYFDITIDPAAYIYTSLIAVAATVLSSFISARHITKQKLADTIRNKMIS